MTSMQLKPRISDRLPSFMILNRALSSFLLGLLATLPFATGAHAAESPSELIGVWHGSIGKRHVVACWDRYGGSYYTRNKPRLITLSPNAQRPDVWLENLDFETNNSWQIEKVVGNHLRGAWTNAPGSPTQAIRLTRVKAPGRSKVRGQDCHFDGGLYESYYAPRVAGERVEPGKKAIFMKKPYRVITAMGGEIASVELIGEDESITQANKILHQKLLAEIRSYLACNDFPLAGGGYFQTKTRLRFWSDDWLSWSSHVEGYCGGAHPFFGSDPSTIDLRTGKEAKLWNWFKLVKKQTDTSEQVCAFLEDRCLPARLAKRVREARASYEYKYCENIDFQAVVDGGYSIGLNEKGIAFVPNVPEPARSTRTCYAHYTIPFAELAPYLNKQGLAAVSRILTPTLGESE